MKATFIFIITVLLTACGGSSETESKPVVPVVAPPVVVDVMPTGLWKGRVTFPNGDYETSILMLSPSGEGRYMSESATGKLQLILDGKNFTAAVTEHDFTFGDSTGEISGSYTDTTITATASYNGVVTSTLSFTKSDKSYNAASFGLITGNYTNAIYDGAIAIDVDGIISGNDAYNCEYDGQVSIPDNNLNIYKLTFSVSQCGDYNGFYTGLATYANMTDQTQFIIMADSNSRAWIVEFLIK